LIWKIEILCNKDWGRKGDEVTDQRHIARSEAMTGACAYELEIFATYGFIPEDTRFYREIDGCGFHMAGNGRRTDLPRYRVL